jgi:sodium transport system permease protein
MRAILTVFRKEFRENLRDRRTLLSALIFGPLLGPVLLAAVIGIVAQEGARVEQPFELAVSYSERAPNLIAFLRQNGVDVKEVELDDAAARAAIRNKTHKLVLLIPPDYATQLESARPAPLHLYSDSSDSRAVREVQRAKAVLGAHGARISQLRLLARGIDPTSTAAIVVNDVDVATPANRAALVLTGLTYVIVLAMLMGGLYLAIDTTAGERERGSLEPLLTTPVRRDHLIYGKIVAASAYMVLSLAISVTALSITLQFVGLENIGMTVNFGPLTALQVAVLCLPLIPVGASLMTIIASFTRTYREAQTYVGLVLIVPTLPLIFASIYGLRPSTALMAVPSLSQHLLITSLVRDEAIPAVNIAVSVGATLAIGLLLAHLAGRLYRRESLLG